MKKTIVYIALSLFAFSGANAQPWMPQGAGHVKLQDVITYYQNHPMPVDGDDDKDGPEKEDKNYQFDRWKWYWENHTDSNGYLVSPVKTWEEWQAYMKKENSVSKLSKTTGTQSQWTFQGPASSGGGYHGVGRINMVSFHPTDSNTVWIGAGGGGVWKTTDAGSTWTSISANLPILGVSDIAFNPLNPNVVYLCTGDKDGGDTYSVGVFKTYDGGQTWDTTGLKFGSSSLVLTNSILINPLDTNTLLLATSQGIYRSLNAGATWSIVFNGDFKQILYNPSDTNIVYATGGLSGGGLVAAGNSQIFRSANGGLTWQVVTSLTGSQRVTLAVTKANPGIVKAIVANSNNFGLNGIYSSSDTGKTFTLIFDGTSCNNNILGFNFALNSGMGCTGQGWYTLSLAISPTDSNALYAGGVNTWGSKDGGVTWQIANQWYSSLPGIQTLHADKHFLAFNPIAPDMLYECNDGGIYKTNNPNSTLWTDITNGLGITQFYRNAVSNVASFVLGGAQDDGCKSVTDSAHAAGEILGGDGMQVQMDYTDPLTFYAESQYGDINITRNGGARMTNISNNIASPAPTGSWVTPYIILPQSPNILLAGFDKVYTSSDYGNSWTAISSVFSSGHTIDRVVVPITNSNYIYVLVNNSIHYSTNFGTTWQSLSLVGFSGQISDIVVDPKNEKNLWVTFSGYSTNKVVVHSLATNTTKLVNGHLPNIPVNCLTIDSSNGMMYIGCDIGVYYYDTTAAKWTLYNNNLPNVVINDLNINYTTGDLWAATFGRGMWKTPKYDTVITSSGVSLIPFAPDVITVSPDPNYGHFTVTTNDNAFVDKKVDARLVNSAGNTVWKSSTIFSNGRLPVDVTVAPGVYIFEAIAGHTVARTRVVIY
ncbi:MAG: hypothetical protein P4L41_10540 [Flavipsychrobacter sp.]|nr:hypothetical protein [Flavipsychrobacter sp.]